jgi:hypothetical protein
MKSLLIALAVAGSLVLSYVSVGRIFLRQDPWPMLYILSIVLIVSVCGLLRRDEQITIGSHE